MAQDNKKKLKILFDGSILSNYICKNSNRAGITFVAYEILQEFLKREGFEVTFFYQKISSDEICKLKPQIQPNCNFIPKNLTTNKFMGKVFEVKKLLQLPPDNFFKKTLRFFLINIVIKIYYNNPFYIKKILEYSKDFDIYFSPSDRIPVSILKNKKIKKFLLIHDLIPVLFERFYKKYHIKNLDGMKKMFSTLNSETNYFTVSENTKKDLLNFFQKKGLKNYNKITTIYLGVNSNIQELNSRCNEQAIGRTKIKYGIEKNNKYILSLCTMEPRKNLPFAIEQFQQFIKKNNITNLDFILAGGQWRKYFNNLDKSNWGQNIKILDYVDDEDVENIYRGAEFFVYPSLYEGFGLPVLEAMSCGCPVITSNTSSMPEVLGDCGILINPNSSEDLLNAYEKYYFDDKFKNDCIQKGLERAKQFSWERTVDIISKEFMR